MTDAITTKEAATLTEKLREKIQSMMWELIPEERWTKLVEKEIESFFESEQKVTIDQRVEERDGYNRGYGNQDRYKDLKVVVTPFRALVYGELGDVAAEKVKKMVREIELDLYSDTGPARGIIDKHVRENMSRILENALRSMLLDGLAQSLQVTGRAHLHVDASAVPFDPNDSNDPNHPHNPNSPNYNPNWVQGPHEPNQCAT